MFRLRLALVFLGLLFGAAAHAVQPDEILPDPKLEARARALSAELRCMVCQNQSIDDSDAPLARDIRLLVRDKLKSGESDQAILAYLVARYGDFILLKPPFNAQTAVLWLTPALMAAVGAAIAWWALRRASRSRREPRPLDAAEAARLDAILAQGEAAGDQKR